MKMLQMMNPWIFSLLTQSKTGGSRKKNAGRNVWYVIFTFFTVKSNQGFPVLRFEYCEHFVVVCVW